MTKSERLRLALAKARSLHDQTRYAEAKLGYEKIIQELMPKKKVQKT